MRSIQELRVMGQKGSHSSEREPHKQRPRGAESPAHGTAAHSLPGWGWGRELGPGHHGLKCQLRLWISF